MCTLLRQPHSANYCTTHHITHAKAPLNTRTSGMIIVGRSNCMALDQSWHQVIATFAFESPAQIQWLIRLIQVTIRYSDTYRIEAHTS